MKFFVTIFFLFLTVWLKAQSTAHARKNVLFLGNSYTGVNNLPQLIATIANSTGDTLSYDVNTPGGYTFDDHSSSLISINKIKLGKWQHVVLQEQSQLPSFPTSQVKRDVFPFAKLLDSIFKKYNPCGETIFYMTWGRKNGDVSNCPGWPPVCTYNGMDSLIYARYMMMADSNQSMISPVGRVWRYLRQHHPGVELYQSDGSHPSFAGSFAAACCFYSIIFQKNPLLIPYNGSLNAADAAIIKNAAKVIAFDSLQKWHIGVYSPKAAFMFRSITKNTMQFFSTATFAGSLSWDFGDGTTSSLHQPIHLYASPGFYNVTLSAFKCNRWDRISKPVNILPTDTIVVAANNLVAIAPNPVLSNIVVKNNSSQLLQYKLINAVGAFVSRGNLPIGNAIINVMVLANGLYIFQVFKNEKLAEQHRFIKMNK